MLIELRYSFCGVPWSAALSFGIKMLQGNVASLFGEKKDQTKDAVPPRRCFSEYGKRNAATLRATSPFCPVLLIQV